MREKLCEVEKLFEGALVDFHRDVLFVENDAMLVVVDIGRILKAPVGAVDGDRNNSVVLSCWVVHSSGISFIFGAEKAFRISALSGELCGGDFFRSFFRL